jgi:hypothetical protein
MPKAALLVYFPFCCGSFCGSYNEIICNGKTIKNINVIKKVRAEKKSDSKHDVQQA